MCNPAGLEVDLTRSRAGITCIMWIFLLYLSACLCQCVDVYNLSYGQRAARLATGLIIISGPRLKPSLDLNHLSSPWALHLIE